MGKCEEAGGDTVSMKYRLIFIIVLIVNSCFANMASPMRKGTSISTVFTSKNIDILNEKIYFKPNKEFKIGSYLIEYHIKTDTSGKQIPLLFYAIDYKENFKVFIDNQEIQLSKLPYSSQDSTTLKIYKQFKLYNYNNELNIDLGNHESKSINIEDKSLPRCYLFMSKI